MLQRAHLSEMNREHRLKRCARAETHRQSLSIVLNFALSLSLSPTFTDQCRITYLMIDENYRITQSWIHSRQCHSLFSRFSLLHATRLTFTERRCGRCVLRASKERMMMVKEGAEHKHLRSIEERWWRKKWLHLQFLSVQVINWTRRFWCFMCFQFSKWTPLAPPGDGEHSVNQLSAWEHRRQNEWRWPSSIPSWAWICTVSG